MVPNPDWTDYDCLPLVMIDANEAIEKFATDAAAPGADATECFQAATDLTRFVPVASPHRWDRLAARAGLWIPHNEYADD